MFSGTAVFNFRKITLSIFFNQKILNIIERNLIFNKYYMKMTDHHATSSGLQECSESAKPPSYKNKPLLTDV